MRTVRIIPALALLLLAASHVQARKWVDASGNYSVEADLIATSDDQAVLKREDGRLVVIDKKQLSQADQEYLASDEAKQLRQSDDVQQWTMKNGWKVSGRVVAYGRREVTIQRRRGKVYVNDRLFDNLPDIYRRMLPRIVSHFENLELQSEEDFLRWANKQGGRPNTFVVDGVMLELENGDEYAVPFIFFSENDLNVLKPGWERWLASHEDAKKRQEEDFLLRAQAAAYHKDRMANQQIAAMQLMLSAVEAGVTDVWEVMLLPRPGTYGRPLIVAVFARDSRQAMVIAMQENPQYVAGPVRKISRPF